MELKIPVVCINSTNNTDISLKFRNDKSCYSLNKVYFATYDGNTYKSWDIKGNNGIDYCFTKVKGEFIFNLPNDVNRSRLILPKFRTIKLFEILYYEKN